MSFGDMGLCAPILKGVQANGFHTPTPIQAQTIPAALQGRDLIGCAPTGTGKTAAFVLPILHSLCAKETRQRPLDPQALILTPTRELAQQIQDCVRTYGRFTNVRSMAIFGGVDIHRQFHQLDRGVDLVIATPGRLIDHLDRGTIDLSRVTHLVLDEADRMFDMGFIDAVRRIIANTAAQRQTLLFSATMTREVRALASAIQKQPLQIDIGEPSRPVETVTQHFYMVPNRIKAELLLHVLRTEPVSSMLVFSRTKHGADGLARRLASKGLSTATIHSNRSQSQRQRALDGFKRGQVRILVATDIAARGIDVQGISYVVNYDIPAFAEDYIHRIGRTGRAQSSGIALSFTSEVDIDNVRKIERLTGKRFEVKKYPGFDYGDFNEADFVPAARPAPARFGASKPRRFDGYRGRRQMQGGRSFARV